ncbi:hypothetical protein ACIA8K_33910 [Catenuloplanes sp. NPDC051500]|uniref:VHL beta domain-containing protein n=1 Tax=Catenuloplanes sp. NPDC051500 TaxID=3363959 RepID=UPI00379D35EB
MTYPSEARPTRWVLHVVLATAAVLAVGAAGAGFVLLRPRDNASTAPPAPTDEAAPAPAENTHENWPELTALPADTAPDGTGSGAETQIAFENHTGERHLISWLEADGTTTAYATLEPGYSYDQPSYAGHYWLVSTADGTPAAVFQAADVPSRAIIG